MTPLAPVLIRDSYGYPTSDGKPMAETDWHRVLMLALTHTLLEYFADDPNVYVTGNLLLFYEEGNRRRHISPDVFVVRGIKNEMRPNYLTWIEGKGPDVVIELLLALHGNNFSCSCDVFASLVSGERFRSWGVVML